LGLREHGEVSFTLASFLAPGPGFFFAALAASLAAATLLAAAVGLTGADIGPLETADTPGLEVTLEGADETLL